MLLANRGLIFQPAGIEQGRGVEQEALYAVDDKGFDIGRWYALAIACLV